jgi:glycosyltransferase involved in cell wall biosynthesis
MTARPAVSVVIATRDRPDKLRRCLEHLAPYLGADDEVVVVDSASRDARTAEVAAAAGAVVVRAERPGTSLARNLGWQRARHDLVAFTDDDVEVDTGWPDAMVAALALPDVAWVTGWIGVRHEQSGAPEFNPTMLVDAPARLDAEHRGATGASANFGAHRSALVAVGGFDVRFGPGTWTAAAEDAELFDRLVGAGLVGRYDPAVRVFHEQWRGRRDAVTLNWRYGKGMGARLARLARRRPRHAARTAYDVVWSQGVVTCLRCLRSRYELGALLAALRVLGTMTGFLVWLPRR